jgi:signal transduction histidine kinase
MADDRVVIVEDEHIVALDIRKTVEGFGFTIAGVHATGESCLASLESEHPDLVLMDARLQGDLDGFETARVLRETHDIPVVMVTAYADESTLERAKVSQPFAYVMKPFDPRELQSAIVMSLYRHRMEHTLRQQEERLRRSEKMEALGRLTGGIAHDFNNLLTVIMGYSQLIRDELHGVPGESGEQILEDVDGIHSAAMRSASLTRQLLSFSRGQNAAGEPVSINRALEKMENLLRQLVRDDVALTLDLADSDTTVFIEQSQLDQVVLNLVVNARDAMPGGGRLVIRTGVRSINQADVFGRGGVRPGAFVEIQVTDTGQGMDSETKSRIFDPFFTTKEGGKGTGLGLSTVYGVVSQRGGFVDVESLIGEGTTFSVCIPVHRMDGNEARQEDEVQRSNRGTETILLVEDDETIRNLLARMLRRNGYTVLDAASPGEALLESERHQGPVHLLLSDVVMPLLSGVRLAYRVRETRPETRVMLMSGYPESAFSREEYEQLGCRFLAKPVEPGVLVRHVRDILDG